LAGLFVIRNSSPNALIAQLQFVDSQGLDRSFLSGYVRKVMAVTPQDIQRVSESYIVPSKMTIVVVGDKAKITEQLKPYENTP
jgi:zinc protease